MLRSVCTYNADDGPTFYTLFLYLAWLFAIKMASLTNKPRLSVALLFLFQLFVLVSGQFSCQPQTVGGKPFPPLIEVTAEDLQIGLESGLFTSVDLVTAYTQRILEVNGTLSVVTELNPDALSIAAELDAERANGTIRGPLHGIPLLIKGNIGTLDKMNTTAGSYALLGAKLPADSGVAAKLRAAGVVILGKSNLSQWANFRSDNSSNGWSAYGGQCTGAYYPLQDPSGSSSGSGVGTSIGLALAALGTEVSHSNLAKHGRS
jgi:amidase